MNRSRHSFFDTLDVFRECVLDWCSSRAIDTQKLQDCLAIYFDDYTGGDIPLENIADDSERTIARHVDDYVHARHPRHLYKRTPDRELETKGQKLMSELERSLINQAVIYMLPVPVTQLRFHPTRKWAFDLAFPSYKMAVEVDGGTFVNGRHNRGYGIENDCEKFNEAICLGWRVLRVTGAMVHNGKALEFMKRALQHLGYTHPIWAEEKIRAGRLQLGGSQFYQVSGRKVIRRSILERREEEHEIEYVLESQPTIGRSSFKEIQAERTELRRGSRIAKTKKGSIDKTRP